MQLEHACQPLGHCIGWLSLSHGAHGCIVQGSRAAHGMPWLSRSHVLHRASWLHCRLEVYAVVTFIAIYYGSTNTML